MERHQLSDKLCDSQGSHVISRFIDLLGSSLQLIASVLDKSETFFFKKRCLKKNISEIVLWIHGLWYKSILAPP